MAGILELLEELYANPYFWEFAVVSGLLVLYGVYYYTYSRAYFLIKPRYDSTKKNLRNPPPPYPNGWYNAIRA